MNIGELARRTGVSIRSLRYYEAKQLLSPQRGENGYRSYDTAAIERVKMIQFYLNLGLTTSEIFTITAGCDPDEVQSLCDEQDITSYLASCPKEVDLYKEKLAEIEAQIAALERARMYLKQRLALVASENDAEESFEL